MRELAYAAVAAALMLAGAPAHGRSFTVDDLLRLESFGAAAIDPQGRWAVFERRGPYDQAPRFDQDQANPIGASRIYLTDLERMGRGELLLPATEPPGQVIGGFSPSGRHLAVYRLSGGDWRLGVVDLASRKVTWLDLRPPQPLRGRVLQWLSDAELLVLDRGDAPLRAAERIGHLSADELPRRWLDSASGRGAHTVVGSGAYRAVRGRPPPVDLVSVTVSTGERRRLARGEIVDFELAPGGRFLAYRQTADDIQSRLGRPVQGDWGVTIQAERLFVVDLVTGHTVGACPGCDVLPSLLAWSPQGTSLLFYARGHDRPWSAGRLRRFDTATARAATLGQGLRPLIVGRPEILSAAWMGHEPIVLARKAAETSSRADWFRLSADGPVNLTAGFVAAPGALTRLDARGLTAVVEGRLWTADRAGRARAVSPPGVADAVRPPTTRDGRPLEAPRARGWVVAEDRLEGWSLEAVEAAGPRPVLPIPRQSEVRAIGPAGVLALVQIGDAGAMTRLELARRGKAPVVLASLNEHLADIDPMLVHRVSHPGPDGQPLQSWLYLPHDRGAGPPPLVVKVYSGEVYRDPPRSGPPVLGLQGDVRVLVGQGFAVLLPSLPLPKRRPGTPAEPTEGLAARILEIVDKAATAAATAGTFDPARLALWGHSYGGYTVMATVSQTRRFRAAVSVAGYADLVGKWASLPAPHRPLQDEGVRSNYVTGGMETGQGAMGVPPWSDPQRYARNSPLLFADRIETPLLLAHGDQDGAVALGQSEAMFSALYRQGKDALLVTYWGEGHYITSPGNVRDLYSRAGRFLWDHLVSSTAASPDAPAAHPGPGPASAAPRLPSPPPPAPRWRSTTR